MNYAHENIAQRDKTQLTENCAGFYAGFVMAQIERTEKAKRERWCLGRFVKKERKDDRVSGKK